METDDVLKVDLFIGSRLFRNNVPLKLRYNRGVTNLIESALVQMKGISPGALRVLISDKNPGPGLWSTIPLEVIEKIKKFYSKDEIRKLKSKYVAIDVKEDADDWLRVDLFKNGKLYQADAVLALYYDNNGNVKITDAAKFQMGIEGNTRARVVFYDKKPIDPINWRTTGFYRDVGFNRSLVDSFRDEYVAIDILESPIRRDFKCAMCSNEAHSVNLHFMEPFCSEACHTVFLSNQ